ncbi:MAG: hypothetical protein ACREMN_11280 [Gemmatimonadales bacterium]
MPLSKTLLLRNTLVFGAVLIGLTTCNHPTGAPQMGQPYTLRTINGRALPFAVNGTPTGPAITQGRITFLAESRVERFERRGRLNGTDSVFTEWTQPGVFFNQLGRIILRYTGWPTHQGGPPAAVDTLEATASGGFTLRQMGLVFRFCPGESDC